MKKKFINSKVVSNSSVIKPIVGADKKGVQLDVQLPITNIQNMNCVANVTNWQKINRYTSNEITVAWEQWLTDKLQLDGDLNFIKNFYLAKSNVIQEKVDCYNQRIVDAYQISSGTAYDQVLKISEHLITEQLIKQAKVRNGRSKVRDRLNTKLGSRQQRKDEDNLKWKFELRRLFHQMREAVEHIMNAEGEKKFQRLNLLIEQKQHITVEFLKGLPKKSQKEIENQLDNFRLYLSKKTDELMVLKEIYGQDFVYDEKTTRELSESGRTGDDTASLLSEKLSASRSKSVKQNRIQEEKKIEKYFDIQTLQKRWNITDQNQIKSAVRRCMVKDTLTEAAHIKAKLYKDELIRTGRWGKPNKIVVPPKPKTKRQELLERAKSERKEKSLIKKVRKNFLGQEINVDFERENKEKMAKVFFQNYNGKNTIGECYDAALRYSQLFQV